MCRLWFCKQKTAYELRISDWSSDVCSSDLLHQRADRALAEAGRAERGLDSGALRHLLGRVARHHVPHLVAQHGGKLVVAFGHLQHAAVDADLAARPGQGVGRRLLEELELPVDALRPAAR